MFSWNRGAAGSSMRTQMQHCHLLTAETSALLCSSHGLFLVNQRLGNTGLFRVRFFWGFFNLCPHIREACHAGAHTKCSKTSGNWDFRGSSLLPGNAQVILSLVGFCQEFIKYCNLLGLSCCRLLIFHVALLKCFVFDFSFVSVSERSVDEHLL